ncbi:MAG: hypothetical protein QE263_02230 [Vampirovibrionales bacterium]|nr:hypothetical protein [Vampirovibrionales bacterium]
MVTTSRIASQSKAPVSKTFRQGSSILSRPTVTQFSGARTLPRQVMSHYGNILVQQASALKYYPAIIASLLLVTFRCFISWGSSIKARGTTQQDYVEKQAYSTTFREIGAFLGTYGFMKLFEANRKRHLLSLLSLGKHGQKLALKTPFYELPRIGPTTRSFGTDLWNSLRGKSISTELTSKRLYLELEDDFSKAKPAKFLEKLNDSGFFRSWMRLSKWFDADARSIALSAENFADPRKLQTVLKAVTKYAPITAGAVLATALSGVLLEWFTLHKMDSFTRWLSGAKPLPNIPTNLPYGAVPVAAQPMMNLRNADALSASQKANRLFHQFQQNQ